RQGKSRRRRKSAVRHRSGGALPAARRRVGARLTVGLALLRKELKVAWASPLPYVLGAAFHATLGVLAWSQITGRQQAVFQLLVPIAGFLLVLVAPIIASRVFADEIRTGTLELLLAIPVPRGRLVAAKYAAIVITLTALL